MQEWEAGATQLTWSLSPDQAGVISPWPEHHLGAWPALCPTSAMAMILSPDPAAACLVLLRTMSRCSSQRRRGPRHPQAVMCWQLDPVEPWSRLTSRTLRQGVRWRLLAQTRDVMLSTIPTPRPPLRVTPMRLVQVTRDTWSGLDASKRTPATGRRRPLGGQCPLTEERGQEETSLMPVKYLHPQGLLTPILPLQRCLESVETLTMITPPLPRSEGIMRGMMTMMMLWWTALWTPQTFHL